MVYIFNIAMLHAENAEDEARLSRGVSRATLATHDKAIR
jgi:hypothetical protein